MVPLTSLPSQIAFAEVPLPLNVLSSIASVQVIAWPEESEILPLMVELSPEEGLIILLVPVREVILRPHTAKSTYASIYPPTAPPVYDGIIVNVFPHVRVLGISYDI
jgi:hypothetical protein